MPRSARPWFRASRNRWYATVHGKLTNLHVAGRENENLAWESYNSRRAGPMVRTEPTRKLVEEYLEDCKARGVAAKTIKAYGFELNWLLAVIGNTAITQIVPEKIQSAAPKRWSDSHRANVLTTVQAFVRWCGRRDFKLARPSKPSRGAQSVITPELWDAIQRETTGDFHQYLKVLWHTGARPSEIAGLTVEGVNWPSRSATLAVHKTSHKGKRRTIFFSDAAIVVLEQQRAKHRKGFLFRGIRGEPFNSHSVGVRFQRLRRRLKCTTTAYCFRHTWATRALSQGHPDTHVANAMGHSSTVMIHRHYSHVGQDARLMHGLMNAVQ